MAVGRAPSNNQRFFGRLEENAIQRSKKARQEEKVEQIFASWWDWIKKTRETPNDPNPYVRLVAMFRG
jgi:hypothetical protein